jgi:hypothetical protein
MNTFQPWAWMMAGVFISMGFTEVAAAIDAWLEEYHRY